MEDNDLAINNNNPTTSGVLKRRNSIPSAVILPNGHNHHNHSHHNQNPLVLLRNHNHHASSPTPLPPPDFELVSLKSPKGSYTSLRDILPTSSSTLSPTPTALTAAISSSSSTGSGYEISIRNRLVKQAAWAYLQPTVSSSPSSSRRLCFFFSGEFLRPVFSDFRSLVVDSVTRAYDWLVDALWLILCR